MDVGTQHSQTSVNLPVMFRGPYYFSLLINTSPTIHVASCECVRDCGSLAVAAAAGRPNACAACRMFISCFSFIAQIECRLAWWPRRPRCPGGPLSSSLPLLTLTLIVLPQIRHNIFKPSEATHPLPRSHHSEVES